MPTKRQFDMVVLVVLLAHPVLGLFRMWAARETSEGEGGFVTKAASAILGLE